MGAFDFSSPRGAAQGRHHRFLLKSLLALMFALIFNVVVDLGQVRSTNSECAMPLIYQVSRSVPFTTWNLWLKLTRPESEPQGWTGGAGRGLQPSSGRNPDKCSKRG